MLDDLPPWLLLDENGQAVTRSESSPADFLGLFVGVALAALEVSTHHSVFTLSNMVACLIATDILTLVGIRSFRTAGVLLIGLLPFLPAPRAVALRVIERLCRAAALQK